MACKSSATISGRPKLSSRAQFPKPTNNSACNSPLQNAANIQPSQNLLFLINVGEKQQEAGELLMYGKWTQPPLITG